VNELVTLKPISREISSPTGSVSREGSSPAIAILCAERLRGPAYVPICNFCIGCVRVLSKIAPGAASLDKHRICTSLDFGAPDVAPERACAQRSTARAV
jgi:hypothetical protein